MRITFLFLTKILFLNEALSIDLNDYDLLLNPLTINNIYFIISVWTSYKNRRGDPTKKNFFYLDAHLSLIRTSSLDTDETYSNFQLGLCVMPFKNP